MRIRPDPGQDTRVRPARPVPRKSPRPAPALPLPRRVAVCIDKSRTYSRGVLRGIADFVESRGYWSLHLEPRASGSCPADWLGGWRGDGVLAYIEDPGWASDLRRLGMPTVELFGHRLDLGLPHVGNDEEAFGRLAAEHLLERRFRAFAFAGFAGALWSERRGLGFAGRLREAGFEPQTLVLPGAEGAGPARWEAEQRRLGAWLRKQTGPVGLMACSDRLALRILDACRREGIAVPEQVAVVGVDNDEEICRLADPPLSSVMDDARTIGWRAAEILDRWMSTGRRPDDAPVLVRPSGVATRRSTDVTAVEDALVARACRLIRAGACSGLTVEGLVRELRVSKSSFYQRFRRALNRLPHEEILRTRLDQARSLLRTTRLTVAEVAGRCGFTHPEYLNVAFKRETGITPRQYREEEKGHGPRHARGDGPRPSPAA